MPASASRQAGKPKTARTNARQFGPGWPAVELSDAAWHKQNILLGADLSRHIFLTLDALSAKMQQWLACLAATSSQDGPTVAGVQGFYALQDSSADFEFGSLQSRSGSKCTLIVMLFVAFSQQCLGFTHRSRQTCLRWAYRPLTASIQWWCSIHSLALLRILVGQLTSYIKCLLLKSDVRPKQLLLSLRQLVVQPITLDTVQGLCGPFTSCLGI